MVGGSVGGGVTFISEQEMMIDQVDTVIHDKPSPVVSPSQNKIPPSHVSYLCLEAGIAGIAHTNQNCDQLT